MRAPAASIFDSVDLDALRRRRSEKWARHPADVLPSFVAELDFGTAPEIAEVLHEAVAAGDLGYACPSPSGLGEGFVAVTSGLAFGQLGAGFVRLNLGTSRALIEQAVDRMASALGGATSPSRGSPSRHTGSSP